MVVRTHARESPPHAAPERRAPRPCSLAWVCCCRADSFPGVRAAANAGFYPTADTALKRLTELGGEAFDAFKAAERPATARRQAGKRENPTQCWLEQEVRERESLYVTIIKPLV